MLTDEVKQVAYTVTCGSYTSKRGVRRSLRDWLRDGKDHLKWFIYAHRPSDRVFYAIEILLVVVSVIIAFVLLVMLLTVLKSVSLIAYFLVVMFLCFAPSFFSSNLWKKMSRAMRHDRGGR